MRCVRCTKWNSDHRAGDPHDPFCSRTPCHAKAVTPSASDRIDLYRFWDIPDLARIHQVVPEKHSIRLKKLHGDDIPDKQNFSGEYDV